MTFASSYPFLDIFLSLVIVFAFVIVIAMVVMILIDVYGRDDVSGWGKAGWTVIVVVLPLIGVLLYLITQRHGMSERHSSETLRR